MLLKVVEQLVYHLREKPVVLSGHQSSLVAFNRESFDSLRQILMLCIKYVKLSWHYQPVHSHLTESFPLWCMNEGKNQISVD